MGIPSNVSCVSDRQIRLARGFLRGQALHARIMVRGAIGSWPAAPAASTARAPDARKRLLHLRGTRRPARACGGTDATHVAPRGGNWDRGRARRGARQHRGRYHGAEVRSAIVVPPVAGAGHGVAHREEERAPWARTGHLEWDGECENVPVGVACRGADVARVRLRDSRPSVSGEARDDGLLECDVAYVYDATQQGGPRRVEGNGFETYVRFWRGVGRGNRRHLRQRETCPASEIAAGIGALLRMCEVCIRFCLCVGEGGRTGDGGGSPGGAEETNGHQLAVTVLEMDSFGA